MARLPEKVISAWNVREGPIVFATVSTKGKPNVIYATCVNLHDEGTVVIADNYFVKTLENITAGSTGAILFLTPDKKSYQIKGPLEYHATGEIYQAMKGWNPTKHPGRAAVALRAEEVYCGSERLL